MHEKMTWSQGKVKEVHGEDIVVTYLYDVHDAEARLHYKSPQLALYRSKSKDFEWRMQLKAGDLVDCEDSFGSYYNATIL